MRKLVIVILAGIMAYSNANAICNSDLPVNPPSEASEQNDPLDTEEVCKQNITFADKSDEYCKRFYVCYRLNEQWNLIIKTCKDKYFNDEVRACTTIKPSYCI